MTMQSIMVQGRSMCVRAQNDGSKRVLFFLKSPKYHHVLDILRKFVFFQL